MAAKATSATTQRLGSIAQVAESHGVSTKTIRRYIADGRLRGYRLGPKTIRVDLDDVDRLLRPIPAAPLRGDR